MLDVEEYLHLALHASSVKDHHACLRYLREALQLEPRNARVLYLLAAQHAELGLIDRGIAGMRAALEREPKLDIARFQLGLMLMDTGRAGEAREHFAQLGASADQALRAYADAITALADNDAAAAQEKLRMGLTFPTANPALLENMRRLLERLSQQVEAPKPGGRPAESSAGSEAGQVFLGAYRK